MQTPESPQTWRQLLGKVLLDKSEFERLRVELGNIDGRTLKSWASGTSNPRLQYLVLLMAALTEYEHIFPALVQLEFPAAVEQYEASLKKIDLTATTIPVDVYERVLKERAVVLNTHALWGISVLALQKLIDQLSQGNELLIAVLVRCVASSGERVTRLQEYVIESNDKARSPMYFMGANSLAGNIVSTGKPHIYNDMREAILVTTDPFATTMQSVAGYPVCQGGNVAGAVLLYSTQQHFFSRRSLELIQRYSELLALAFAEKDFFKPDAFALQVIPEAEIQQRWWLALRERITERLVQAERKGLSMTYTQAETLVLEQLLTEGASDATET